jgi:23S rRNA pseudouridine2605 synthase
MVAGDEPSPDSRTRRAGGKLFHGGVSVRLGKYLAHAGVASRRAAERIVAEGRVTVAGHAVIDPALDVDEHSAVAVDGRPVAGPEPRVVLALHKPVGVVSTARDTHGRRTVLDLVAGDRRVPGDRREPGDRRRLYPIGRLDADSSGLILLSNDGELANRLTHPRFQVPKTYRARVRGGPVSNRALQALRDGVQLDDGRTAPARVRRLAPDRIELTIHEGRNRQVRRMCQAVGHPVIELQRTRFGPLTLDGLAPGQHRQLTRAELARLRELAL